MTAMRFFVCLVNPADLKFKIYEITDRYWVTMPLRFGVLTLYLFGVQFSAVSVTANVQ